MRTRLRRACAAIAAAATLTLTVAGPGAGTASAAPTIAVSRASQLAEAQLLWQINADRARAGLPALAAQPVLLTQTDAWSTWMAAHGYLFHHPDLGAMATQAQPWGWSSVAENVGAGTDGLSLHQRFMSSPGHARNVYGSFRSVGVGAVESGGRIWVTVRFLR
ncbi:MAG: CAP domain-containing protein [Acidimicrobiia bacterium]